MNVKTMEGLAGASTSVSLASTPMNIAKEAERKGDIDKMKRAMGYAAGMMDEADQYSEKASQGMKLDAEKAKEQEKLRQEELVKARKEEHVLYYVITYLFEHVNLFLEICLNKIWGAGTVFMFRERSKRVVLLLSERVLWKCSGLGIKRNDCKMFTAVPPDIK